MVTFLFAFLNFDRFLIRSLDFIILIFLCLLFFFYKFHILLEFNPFFLHILDLLYVLFLLILQLQFDFFLIAHMLDRVKLGIADASVGLTLGLFLLEG